MPTPNHSLYYPRSKWDMEAALQSPSPPFTMWSHFGVQPPSGITHSVQAMVLKTLTSTQCWELTLGSCDGEDKKNDLRKLIWDGIKQDHNNLHISPWLHNIKIWIKQFGSETGYYPSSILTLSLDLKSIWPVINPHLATGFIKITILLLWVRRQGVEQARGTDSWKTSRDWIPGKNWLKQQKRNVIETSKHIKETSLIQDENLVFKIWIGVLIGLLIYIIWTSTVVQSKVPLHLPQAHTGPPPEGTPIRFSANRLGTGLDTNAWGRQRWVRHGNQRFRCNANILSHTLPFLFLVTSHSLSGISHSLVALVVLRKTL